MLLQFIVLGTFIIVMAHSFFWLMRMLTGTAFNEWDRLVYNGAAIRTAVGVSVAKEMALPMNFMMDERYEKYR